jgi:hypothetical protein
LRGICPIAPLPVPPDEPADDHAKDREPAEGDRREPRHRSIALSMASPLARSRSASGRGIEPIGGPAAGAGTAAVVRRAGAWGWGARSHLCRVGKRQMLKQCASTGEANPSRAGARWITCIHCTVPSVVQIARCFLSLAGWVRCVFLSEARALWRRAGLSRFSGAASLSFFRFGGIL